MLGVARSSAQKCAAAEYIKILYWDEYLKAGSEERGWFEGNFWTKNLLQIIINGPVNI